MSYSIFKNFSIEAIYRFCYIFFSLLVSFLACFNKYFGFFFILVSPLNYSTLFSSWDLFFITPTQQIFSVMLVCGYVCFFFVLPLFFLHFGLFFYCFFFDFEQTLLSFWGVLCFFFVFFFEYFFFIIFLPIVIFSLDSFRFFLNHSLFFLDLIPSVFSYLSFCLPLAFFIFIFCFFVFVLLFVFSANSFYFVFVLKQKKLVYYFLLFITIIILPPDFIMFTFFILFLSFFIELFILYFCFVAVIVLKCCVYLKKD